MPGYLLRTLSQPQNLRTAAQAQVLELLGHFINLMIEGGGLRELKS